ncbi:MULTISPECIES: GntR family transcriptional regulator [unclassified Saccharothrix]|uniref:GntR family transcriptional regulator n=1 Tax=unclassified Saccharothrix TaxID=2593673 RepID=UPI00307EBC03
MTATGGEAVDQVPPHRLNTADQVAAVLRKRITDGLLEPGRQLREEQLSTALGISRNTIREAFRVLLHDELIVREPYRGVFVRVVTAEDVEDVFRTRKLLEPLGLDALVADPSAAARLIEIADTADTAAQAGDWRAVGTANLDLHRALVEPCRSRRLDRLFTQLLAELRLAFLLADDPQPLHEPYLAWNRRIAELVVAGDAEAARRELLRYLDDAERRITAAVRAKS